MERMVRKAADNKYLHKDFHCGLNLGIDYIAKLYGDEAIVEYLTEYARVFHKPLIEAVKKEGLKALEDYFTKLYETEEAIDDIKMTRSDNELVIEIEKCPAIMHIKKQGGEICDTFVETTNTVNKTIVEDTPFEFELVSFDKETGKSNQRFYRKGE